MSKLITGKTAKEWFDRGLYLAQKDDLKQAIECFINTVKIDPNHSMAWNYLGLYNHKLLYKSCHDRSRKSGWVV